MIIIKENISYDNEEIKGYKRAVKLYNEFKTDVKHNNRFCISDKIINIFQDIIEENKFLIEPDICLYRARVHTSDLEEIPYQKDEIGVPPVELSGNGRLNPRGVSYLYLAGSTEAAIAEVRPNIGNKVTIGEFKTKNYLRLVVFDRGISTIGLKDEWKSGETNSVISNFMMLLNIDFSKIINGTDREKELDYIPTQVFASFCAANGIDGIVFPSSVYENVDKRVMGDRIQKDCNCVLFDSENVEFIKSEIKKINDIKYSIE